VFADAQALPFRDNYADVVVSRGSFPFWEDKRLGFAEVYRVLKPGGVAYIGRGFSENLPVETARTIRDRQKQGGKQGPPPYNVDETERELRSIMRSLKIKHYTIHRPQPPGSEGINYGIWIEIHKRGKT
jgi:SAM-dependent methyltransferase